MKKYLLVYGKELGSHAEIKGCLDSMPEIVSSWRTELPNSFFVLSDVNAKTLGTLIKECRKVDTPRFLITEISDNNWGWLVKDSWTFLGRKAQPEPDPTAKPRLT